MHYFLGSATIQFSDDIFISQNKYAQDLLRKLQMRKFNPIFISDVLCLKLDKDPGSQVINGTHYKHIVQNLICLTTTWPGIMHVVILISRYMNNPK